jgi:hypothetical protein
MKADGGIQLKLHTFFTSTLEGSNRSINVSAALLQAKHTRYPFGKNLGVFQSLPGPFGGKFLIPLPRIERLFFRYPVRKKVTTLTELSRSQ